MTVGQFAGPCYKADAVSDLISDLASLKIQREEDPNRPRPGRMILWVALVLAAVAGVGYVGYPALEARIFKTEVAVTEISMVSPAQAPSR